jgi:hypothetical protein
MTIAPATATRLALAGAALAAALAVTGLALRPSLGGTGFILFISPAFVAVGALLAARRPANPIGWLFLACGLTGTLAFALGQYATRALAEPGSLPAGNLTANVALHLWHPSFGFFVLSLLLFPDGRPLSRRWAWVARVTVGVYAAMLLTAPFDQEPLPEEFAGAEPLFDGAAADVLSGIFAALLTSTLVLLPLAGASLLVRLKRSRGETRQQVKLFVYTVALVMFAFPAGIFVFGDGAYGVFLLALIPVSAGVAILKYHLYDIDVVINRALVYGALTAILAGAYLGSVLLVGLTVGESGLAVAVSTLAVAALFRPARARVQGLVDRRFYRRRYDAARTLEAFGGRLRDEVDLDTLGSDLRGVVRETVQPAHVSLWLRERTP